MQHSSNTAKKSQDCTTLQGKFTKLINAKFLLRCALLTDVLAEAKHFSLISQAQNIDIIRILDSVENKNIIKNVCSRNYERIRLMFFSSQQLRPVSSMLTFPLWYNFPPLSMRITSWILKKSQPLLKKLSAKKLSSRQVFLSASCCLS